MRRICRLLSLVRLIGFLIGSIGSGIAHSNLSLTQRRKLLP